MLACIVPAGTGAGSDDDAAIVGARARRVEVPNAGWFTATLDPANGTEGWQLEMSDGRQRIVDRGDRLDCTAGGFSASTHYARARRRLPETDDLAPSGAFTIAADIELPADFYDRHDSYVRLITTDNHPASMRSTGDRVGAASGDEWRVGFLIYAGDERPRLVSEHENRDTIVLWEGHDRLPTGRHSVEIRVTPSRSSDGSFAVLIDGDVVGEGSSLRTVPRTLSSSEMVVTRVGGCLDGAASQDRQAISMSLRSLTFSARR